LFRQIRAKYAAIVTVVFIECSQPRLSTLVNTEGGYERIATKIAADSLMASGGRTEQKELVMGEALRTATQQTPY